MHVIEHTALMHYPRRKTRVRIMARSELSASFVMYRTYCLKPNTHRRRRREVASASAVCIGHKFIIHQNGSIRQKSNELKLSHNIHYMHIDTAVYTEHNFWNQLVRKY